MDKKRVVVWYSCGVTSAVAAKLAIKKYRGKLPIEIVYTDTGSEHPDNYRFIDDCEEWFGQFITTLRSDKYHDIWEVFEKTKYLSGVKGARCTVELKKRLRQQFEDLEGDIQIFGFDAGEVRRADRFRGNNPEVHLETPLIEKGLTKADCLAIVKEAGIELPAMYKLGYRNNNCIGCVKGQGGYWNKIRKDFPDVFKRMAEMEAKLDVAICKTYKGDGKRKRLFLKDLPEDFGNYKAEPDISCGLLCEVVQEEIK